jgi:hypothetical protein
MPHLENLIMHRTIHIWIHHWETITWTWFCLVPCQSEKYTAFRLPVTFADGFTFLQKQWIRHESGLFSPQANFKIVRATSGSRGNGETLLKKLRAFCHYTDRLDVKRSRSLRFFIWLIIVSSFHILFTLLSPRYFLDNFTIVSSFNIVITTCEKSFMPHYENKETDYSS